MNEDTRRLWKGILIGLPIALLFWAGAYALFWWWAS